MIFSKKTETGTGTGQSASSQASENTRILALLAQDYLKDRKSKRRWGVFFKLLVLGYVAVTAWFYYQSADLTVDQPHTAIVEIDGIIGPGENSAEMIGKSLADAFQADGARGIVIKINSPGGTPVQAAQINEEITRLKSLHPDKPVYVAITDVCASGGYYIAVAADQIYAHPASIVGSIHSRPPRGSSI